jgi:hypothetical protein
MSKFVHQSTRIHCNLLQAYQMFITDEKLEKWLCDKADTYENNYNITIKTEKLVIDTQGSQIKERIKEKKLVIHWVEEKKNVESTVEINFMQCAKRTIHCVEIHLLHKDVPEEMIDFYNIFWQNALDTLRYYYNNDWVIQDGDLTLTKLTGRSL